MSIKFKYKPIKYNHSSRGGKKVEWIIIHDTANTGRGAGAENHYKYFSGGNRGASAHYFVDDKEIIQIVGDSRSAWSVGDNQGKGRYLNGATNQNSISIEICVNSDGNYNKAYYNAVELTKNLQDKFKIPHNRVARHYDVSRKTCPRSMSANNWAKWKQFQKDIKQPKRLIIDTTKDSVAKVVETPSKPKLVLYRVRKEWDDVKSQQGAYSNKNNAIDLAKKLGEPYKVFDNSGKVVYKVPKKHWSDEAFEYLDSIGLGFHERRPDDNLTRAEFASYMARVLKLLTKK